MTDNGGTANGGVNTSTQTFTVTVKPVNQPPTLSAITIPAADPRECQPQQTINLTGITAGAGDTDSDPDRLRHQQQPGPDPQPGGHLHQPQHHRHAHLHAGGQRQRHGEITVTVTDNGGTANGGLNTVSQTFTVTVLPVNQPPTLDPITNPVAINENADRRTPVTLTGISDGDDRDADPDRLRHQQQHGLDPHPRSPTPTPTRPAR